MSAIFDKLHLHPFATTRSAPAFSQTLAGPEEEDLQPLEPREMLQLWREHPGQFLAAWAWFLSVPATVVTLFLLLQPLLG